MTENEGERYWPALRRAVEAALEPYGPQAATVEERTRASKPILWTLDITPTAPGAAHAYVTDVDGTEVIVGFAYTYSYMYDPDPETLAREVQNVLSAVFAGNFVEAGGGDDAFARVRTSRGEVMHGRFHFPFPWRWRRTRTYTPYSAAATPTNDADDVPDDSSPQRPQGTKEGHN